MPEAFESLRESLYRDTQDVPWAAPADIRRRGTQRARRQLVLTSLAVLLVIGGGITTGAAVVNRDSAPRPAVTHSPTTPPPTTPPTATPSETPSQSPSRTPSHSPATSEPTVDVPDHAMLQPSDVAHNARLTSAEGTEDGSLGWLFSAVCVSGDWTNADDDTVDHNERIIKPYLTQYVVRHRSGNAERYFQ